MASRHRLHLQDELGENNDRITVVTQYGPVIGGRTSRGVATFLEIPYALPPKRFTDPEPLPPDFRYEEKEYIRETSYAAQPDIHPEKQEVRPSYASTLGPGQPTENPLFLNILIPPSFPTQKKFPVNVHFHDGFLQIGSPHDVTGQGRHVCAEMSEIWVNVGYRLSAFGFLASHRPKLTGNYGFKDQWLALEWIKSNIKSFGGDPDNIQLQGHLKGCDLGSSSIHQLLHKASCLPEGQFAPFQSAMLQSNAMLTDPKTVEELQPQFEALCRALELDPDSEDILDTLRDPVKVPWTEIARVIKTRPFGLKHEIFRACASDDWIWTEMSLMERQRNGDFARGLRERGVQFIIVGEVQDEWYHHTNLYPISSPASIGPLLKEHLNNDIIYTIMKCIDIERNQKHAKFMFAVLFAAGLVSIPIRLLHEDLLAANFPVIRYRIEWAPKLLRRNKHDVCEATFKCPRKAENKGHVVTDTVIWSLITPTMTPDEANTARNWLKRVRYEVAALKAQKPGSKRDPTKHVLKLTKDGQIKWSADDPALERIVASFKEQVGRSGQGVASPQSASSGQSGGSAASPQSDDQSGESAASPQSANSGQSGQSVAECIVAFFKEQAERSDPSGQGMESPQSANSGQSGQSAASSQSANPRDHDAKESDAEDEPSVVDDHGALLIVIETDADVDPEIIGYIEDLMDIDPERVRGRDFKAVAINRRRQSK